MIQINLDIKEFARRAEQLKSAVDQVPYALSRAMNDAAFVTRKMLVEGTWQRSVTQRNPNFPRAVIGVKRSTKTDLEVRIEENRPNSGHLFLHASGGTKTSQRGRNLAIPLATWVTYTSRGVAKRQLPKAIIANTPPRALRITPTGIFVGEHGRLRLRYSLKPTAKMRADVPFYQDFDRIMRSEINKAFPIRLQEAMRTRR